MPSKDPARPGVGRVMFDRYSQGAGGYSLQTKGVSAVKLCLGKRRKKEKNQPHEQNTVDLFGFLTPAK